MLQRAPKNPKLAEWFAEHANFAVFPFLSGNKAVSIAGNVARETSAFGSGVSQQQSLAGPALVFSGSQSSGACSWGAISTFVGLTAQTLIFRGILAAGGEQKIIAQWGGSTSLWTFLLSVQSNGTVLYAVGNGTGGLDIYQTTGTIARDRPVTIITSWEPGTCRISIDARLEVLSSSSISAIGGGASSFQIGVADDGSPLNGALAFAGGFSKAIPPSLQIKLGRDLYGTLLETSKAEVFAAPAGAITVALGLAAETDSCLSLASAKNTAIGLLSEFDTVTNCGVSKALSIGLLTETETAQTLTATKTVILGLVTEIDSALSFSSTQIVEIGIVSEAATLGGLSVEKTLGVSQATETETVQTLAVLKTVELAQVVENETALSLGTGYFIELGLLTESDNLFTLGSAKTLGVGLLVETDSLFSVTYPGSLTLSAADIAAIADAVWAHPKALTLGKYLGLR